MQPFLLHLHHATTAAAAVGVAAPAVVVVG
jgi:hypothetical protein